MESSWKNIFFANLSLKKIEIWVSNLSLIFWVFEILKFWNLEVLYGYNANQWPEYFQTLGPGVDIYGKCKSDAIQR